MTDSTVIMRNMGYPDSEQGYYVTQLRELVATQVANGLVNRSGGSWAPGAETMPYEERAKAQLAFDWTVDHGYSHKVELLDGRIIEQSYDLRTGKRTRKINWKYIAPTIRDKARRMKMTLVKPFLPKNPYR